MTSRRTGGEGVEPSRAFASAVFGTVAVASRLALPEVVKEEGVEPSATDFSDPALQAGAARHLRRSFAPADAETRTRNNTPLERAPLPVGLRRRTRGEIRTPNARILNPPPLPSWATRALSSGAGSE